MKQRFTRYGLDPARLDKANLTMILNKFSTMQDIIPVVQCDCMHHCGKPARTLKTTVKYSMDPVRMVPYSRYRSLFYVFSIFLCYDFKAT